MITALNVVPRIYVHNLIIVDFLEQQPYKQSVDPTGQFVTHVLDHKNPNIGVLIGKTFSTITFIRVNMPMISAYNPVLANFLLNCYNPSYITEVR